MAKSPTRYHDTIGKNRKQFWELTATLCALYSNPEGTSKNPTGQETLSTASKWPSMRGTPEGAFGNMYQKVRILGPLHTRRQDSHVANLLVQNLSKSPVYFEK